MLKNWKVWLGFGISAIAFYFGFKNIPLRELGNSLAHANWIWMLPAWPIWLITLAARAQRWGVLMEDVPFWTALHTTNIGYALNMVLPARLGEVARVVVIHEKTKIPVTKVVSSIVVERLLDIAVVLGMLAVFTQFLPVPPGMVGVARLLGVLVLMGLGAGVVLVWQARSVENILARILKSVLPKFNAAPILARFRELCAGFAVIGTPKRFAQVIFYTVLLWAGALLFAYFNMMAFLPARFDQAGLFLVAANLGGAVPSAPGALGVQEAAAVGALAPFNLDQTKLYAYALTWAFTQRIVLIVLGAIGAVLLGVSLKQLTQAKPVVASS